jgi:hypothetical protein
MPQRLLARGIPAAVVPLAGEDVLDFQVAAGTGGAVAKFVSHGQLLEVDHGYWYRLRRRRGSGRRHGTVLARTVVVVVVIRRQARKLDQRAENLAYAFIACLLGLWYLCAWCVSWGILSGLQRAFVERRALPESPRVMRLARLHDGEAGRRGFPAGVPGGERWLSLAA